MRDAVRNAVDDRQQDGQFILTGSATPSEALIRHSGTMRVSRLRMRPMSLFESGDSTGAISLDSGSRARHVPVDGPEELSVNVEVQAIP